MPRKRRWQSSFLMSVRREGLWVALRSKTLRGRYMHLVRAAQTENNLNTNLFDEFWLLYPRKEGKKECRQVWDRIPESERIPILEAVVAWRNAWSAEGRTTHYIKMPREWLILERWTDEVPVELKAPIPVASVITDLPRKSGEIPQHVKDALAKLRR